jgi:hypothetical protein
MPVNIDREEDAGANAEYMQREGAPGPRHLDATRGPVVFPNVGVTL